MRYIQGNKLFSVKIFKNNRVYLGGAFGRGAGFWGAKKGYGIVVVEGVKAGQG